MDQMKLQTAVNSLGDKTGDAAVSAVKSSLGDDFKEGDTMKVTNGSHGTSATWRRPSARQTVTANKPAERQAKSPVKTDKKLAGAPENK